MFLHADRILLTPSLRIATIPKLWIVLRTEKTPSVRANCSQEKPLYLLIFGHKWASWALLECLCGGYAGKIRIFENQPRHPTQQKSGMSGVLDIRLLRNKFETVYGRFLMPVVMACMLIFILGTSGGTKILNIQDYVSWIFEYSGNFPKWVFGVKSRPQMRLIGHGPLKNVCSVSFWDVLNGRQSWILGFV